MDFSPGSRSSAARAFTLVELLAVVAIIGLLVALILPAVQASRESARLSQCRNNVRQMALASVQHENALGMFPVASSGYGRTGDADLGAGEIKATTPDYPSGSFQTGGWQYNILPYMEQVALHQLGDGLSGAAKKTEANKRIGTVVPAYVCPSRSDPKVPVGNLFTNAGGTGWPGYVVRSDFAGSMGSLGGVLRGSPGRRAARVLDGISNVFLCGHRFLNPLEYNLSGNVPCNNEGWTVGFDWDNMANTDAAGPEWGDPGLKANGPFVARNHRPLQDIAVEPTCGQFPPGAPFTWFAGRGGRFGSPHASLPMAMADGSVLTIDYGIDVAVFERLGNIADGGTTDGLQ